MTLGQRIQEGRAALGLSQEGLGEKLGVSRQAVSKWEADAAVPDIDKLIALSKLFGVSLNGLLQAEEPQPAAPAPPADSPARKRRRKWALIAAAVIFAAMAIDLFAVNFTLQRLSRQMAAMEEELNPTALDPEKELVYDFAYSYGQSQLPDRMTYDFRLTPAQRPQGLTVTYLIAAGDGAAPQELPATRYGDVFILHGVLGEKDEWKGDAAVTVLARFTDERDGVLETELLRFTHSRPNQFQCEELWRTAQKDAKA